MVLSDVPVKQLPKCQWKGCDNDAHYDCPTALGSWGYLCEDHYRQHGKTGGNRLYVLQEKQMKHLEGVPIVSIKAIDEWGDNWIAVCPLCKHEKKVEPDANYQVECPSCKQPYRCKSMF